MANPPAILIHRDEQPPTLNLLYSPRSKGPCASASPTTSPCSIASEFNCHELQPTSVSSSPDPTDAVAAAPCFRSRFQGMFPRLRIPTVREPALLYMDSTYVRSPVLKSTSFTPQYAITRQGRSRACHIWPDRPTDTETILVAQ